jgi:hypothetical protein
MKVQGFRPLSQSAYAIHPFLWSGIRVFAISATLLTSGCLRSAPKMPPALANAAPIAYTGAEYTNDVQHYRDAMTAKDSPGAKVIRDQIGYRVMAQIDLSYGHFEGSVIQSQAAYQTAGDAAQLGMTAASTLVGATAVKDILTATATAFQGTRTSFDKNFFAQKTSESLVSQMRASRKLIAAQMIKSLASRDVQSYPIESVWSDLVSYYYAGTINSALIDLASATGSAATDANTKLKNAVDAVTQAKFAVDVRTEYEVLNKQLKSTDTATASAAKATLLKILKAAGVNASDSDSTDTLLQDLRTAMADAAPDTSGAKLKVLNDAVAAAMK